jgi:hypothetical protein
MVYNAMITSRSYLNRCGDTTTSILADPSLFWHIEVVWWYYDVLGLRAAFGCK